MNIEFSIKGVILNEFELRQCYDYYKRTRMANELISLCNLSEQQALCVAQDIRDYLGEDIVVDMDTVYHVIHEIYPEIIRDLAEDAVNRDIKNCPFVGDISDDCADCVYGEDYHYSDSECKEREDK